MKVTVGEKEAEIMVGHITMANDPFMIDEVNNRINDGKCAEQAIDEVCDMFYAMFDASEEQLIRERCADVQDIRTGILAELLGKELVDLSVLPKDSIVVVHDLTPSMTATIDKENVVGIVTEVGGRTSHSAIIARALEIPAVLSLENACSLIKNGDTVVVNGTTGEVVLAPSETELEGFRDLAEKAAAEKAALEAYRGVPTKTADGLEKLLVANIGNPDDANVAAELDAEGVEYNKNIEVVTMMETPAASLIADDLAAECDFFSIGTNDLIGYTMCADRGNDAVRYLYTVYQPAVLRSIKRIIEEGNKAGIMVGMCGEAAADPLLIPMLISFGLDEFSVSAPSILRTRKIISQWTKAEADALAEKVLALKTKEEVKAALEAAQK